MPAQLDRGVAVMKKAGLICPFTTVPEQYGIEGLPIVYSLCWFKAENQLQATGKVDPLAAACFFTTDYGLCSIFQTNVPPL